MLDVQFHGEKDHQMQQQNMHESRHMLSKENIYGDLIYALPIEQLPVIFSSHLCTACRRKASVATMPKYKNVTMCHNLCSQVHHKLLSNRRRTHILLTTRHKLSEVVHCSSL
jgi:hypothetical protein